MIKELDEVRTPEGKLGVVVGILGDLIEVRDNLSRATQPWPAHSLTLVSEYTEPEPEVEIATPEAALSYQEARALGLNPTVPAEAFGLEEPPRTEGKRSTIAQAVEDREKDVPRSPRTGRPLQGAALRNYRNKQGS